MTESWKTIWRYQRGAWSQAEHPVSDWADGEDFDKAAARYGFTHADDLGTPGGETVAIYEEGGKEHWLLSCCFNASNIHVIEVTDLPDLLDILPRLAAVASASLASGEAMTAWKAQLAQSRRG